MSLSFARRKELTVSFFVFELLQSSWRPMSSHFLALMFLPRQWTESFAKICFHESPCTLKLLENMHKTGSKIPQLGQSQHLNPNSSDESLEDRNLNHKPNTLITFRILIVAILSLLTIKIVIVWWYQILSLNALRQNSITMSQRITCFSHGKTSLEPPSPFGEVHPISLEGLSISTSRAEDSIPKLYLLPSLCFTYSAVLSANCASTAADITFSPTFGSWEMMSCLFFLTNSTWVSDTSSVRFSLVALLFLLSGAIFSSSKSLCETSPSSAPVTPCSGPILTSLGKEVSDAVEISADIYGTPRPLKTIDELWRRRLEFRYQQPAATRRRGSDWSRESTIGCSPAIVGPTLHPTTNSEAIDVDLEKKDGS
ncbi:outer arm dynein light chain 1 protein [Striga asiatica]|uniref:Outer arm dynein light chain 1 protein n=1 Tax=Striga asiatica TaxID=4170 RepID=A0A5A7PAI1_STRAF|nr:outer arm dynein light chain 1 protein [Striga asiatica]